MLIRSETRDDIALIFAVTQTAFATNPHSRKVEGLIIDSLRNRGSLALSLLAEEAGQIVGHAAFSPVNVSSDETDWFGLGPVAVLPQWQNEGIGSRLIQTGLRQLRRQGAAGCVVLGEPDYYQRFGFRHDPTMVLRGVPPEYFMVLPFQPRSGKDAQREVTYHSSFYALD